MLIFKKIWYKNFLSCGNNPISINLNSHSNSLIIGKNGSGKSSSVTDSITFALFGKPFRDINKPSVVNSENNKDCLVEIELEVNGKEYKVRRGIKPNIFEIYKDNELIEKESLSSEYQNHLENNILKMSYKTFVQIVILGSASFVPFMQLKSSDRKEIIENLLDCQIFSTMEVLSKQNLKNTKASIEKNNSEKNILENTLDHLKSTISKIQSSQKINVQELKNELQSNENKIIENQKKIDEYQNIEKTLLNTKKEIIDSKKNLQEFVLVKSKLEMNIDNLKKEINFFEKNDNCVTCKQSIDDLFKKEKINSNKENINIRSEKITEIEKTSKKIEKNINKLEDELNNLTKRFSQIQILKNEINSIRTLNKSLESRINENEKTEDVLNETIKKKNEVEKRLKSIEKDLKSLLDDKEYLDQIVHILKDGSIKAKIIKKYIPKFNFEVNKYLKAMNLYVNFNLDENFDEVIKSRYKTEFKYANFSEGEKFRIDLAILFAWRYIVSQRNSINTNLLVMDEIFDSSLDSDGADDFIKIMFNDLAKNTNLFIISHRHDTLRDKFERVLEFEKTKGFTHLKES